MKFKESELAHHFLTDLLGIEIGAAAHNPFGLHAVNVDYSADMTTSFKQWEVEQCGEAARVDVVACGDKLPFATESLDFVLTSHVLEHFPDPIKALQEWWRVIRSGGYVFAIVPHKERTFDKERPRSTLSELIQRHETGQCPDPWAAHCSVWITEDVIELATYLGYPISAVQDVDDKVGNGFTIVLRKPT
jgi:ubiquinone/menaquinone biosynthesis C-methylase UbiE